MSIPTLQPVSSHIITITDTILEVTRAVLMEIRVAWDVTTCRMVTSRRFEEPQRLHLQSRAVQVTQNFLTVRLL